MTPAAASGGFAGCAGEVFRWLGDEFLAAAAAAERVSRAVVFGFVLRRRRVDVHAADRIFHRQADARSRRFCVVVMMGVRRWLGGEIAPRSAANLVRQPSPQK